MSRRSDNSNSPECPTPREQITSATLPSASDDPEARASDNLMDGRSSEETIATAKLDTTQGIRRRGSSSTIQQFFLDTLLMVPSICFIIYGIIALRNNGQPIDEDPVPALRTAATYSPTAFPIAFTAVTANLLKAVASWKMERGITVLSLEYLLSCRTIFSALTTPLSLRRTSILTPLLILLWALSPFGGQAALRLINVVPSEASEPWPFEYLDFISVFPHSGPRSSAGFGVMPSIQGAFLSALASPEDIKTRPRDLFGNAKIPMIEHHQQPITTYAGGWHDVGPTDASVTWSSIIGIPVATLGGLSQGHNYSLIFNTSYMSADCSVQRGASLNLGEWLNLMNATEPFTNQKTLIIMPKAFHNKWMKTPRELMFISYYRRDQTTTNATCALRTTHVEVDIACHGPVCGARRIRRIQKPENMTVTTVLDGILAEESEKFQPATLLFDFMATFLYSTLTSWEIGDLIKLFPSPLETYFTHPGTPFSAPGIGDYNGADIYPVEDKVFSQRFSQLLNTFWLSSVASRNITGNFNFQAPETYPQYETMVIQNITGTRLPDQLVMRVSGLWITILFIASTVMLASGIMASVFGCLRRGPDVFDRATFFLRDSPYVNVYVAQQGSLEDGISQVKRTKSVRVCIGDIRPTEETGIVALGTVGEVMPLGLQEKERRYA